jgi:hypothetical protein
MEPWRQPPLPESGETHTPRRRLSLATDIDVYRTSAPSEIPPERTAEAMRLHMQASKHVLSLPLDSLCFHMATMTQRSAEVGVTPVSQGQSRVHSICVPGSISTHMLMSQV